jgi:hypothetical protein
MKTTFNRAETYYAAVDETNNDHGRIESRQCVVLPLMYLFGMKIKWQGLKSLVLMISERGTYEKKPSE